MTGLIIFIAWCVLCTMAVLFNYGAHYNEAPRKKESE